MNYFSLILMISVCVSGVCWLLKLFSLLNFYNYSVSYKLYYSICDILKYIVNYLITLYNRFQFIKLVASMFPMLFSVFIIRSFVFEPFRIPSESMMPTLLSGDFILVNKFSYGIKNPVNQTTLFYISHPKRGDVAVFKYPANPKLNYIKRVIGLPGDKIIYDMLNKCLIIFPNYIDGGSCNYPITTTYSDIKFSNFIQVFNVSSDGHINSVFLTVEDYCVNSGIRLIQSIEYLNDKKYYSILTMTAPMKGNEYIDHRKNHDHSLSEWIVPKGKYFLMGDNRDNSSDSRCWGFVPERNMVGKAVVVWMSYEKPKNKWFLSLRLWRIGIIY